MIYADNAATTKPYRTVVNKVEEYMSGDKYGNPSSLHSYGSLASAAIADARKCIANCVGCNFSDVYFTSGGTESNNTAIISAAEFGKSCGKMHIVTTAFEHPSVLNVLHKLERDGFRITYVMPDKTSQNIIAGDVVSSITDDTCLVTTMYANNEIGSILPIKEIGTACRERGVLFHVDAVQAVGHIPVDFNDSNIDMMSISAHKFHGPKGVGALIARAGVNLTPLILGGGQQHGARSGTENVPGIVGMAEAIRISVEHMDVISQCVSALRDKFFDRLKQKLVENNVGGVYSMGDPDNHLPGIISLCIEDIEAESLLLLLDGKGICISAGSACASGSLKPSHVMTSIGVDSDLARGAVRISFSEFNTGTDADFIVDNLVECVSRLRKFV